MRLDLKFILFLCISVLLTGCLGVTKDQLQNERPEEHPQVIIKTTEGNFTIGLLTQNAPETTDKFLYWCKGVEMPGGMRQSLYVGTQFYRVMAGKFVEGGDPFNSGIGSEKFQYPFEATKKLMTRGTVCIVSDGKGNNNCIFFILLVDNPKLQGKHTAFGVVTQGIEVLDRISNVETSKEDPSKPMRAVTIIGVDVL